MRRRAATLRRQATRERKAAGEQASLTARDELLARFRDESAGPPERDRAAGSAAPRTAPFIIWTSPPLPTVTVACGPECGAGE